MSEKFTLWNMQQEFLELLQESSQSLMSSLDSRLNPEVFLVAIKSDSDGLSAKIIAPDKCVFQNFEFDNLNEVSKSFSKSPLQRVAMKNDEFASFLSPIRRAIVQILNTSKINDGKLEFYISLPAEVNDYDVCVVMGLQKNVLDSYPRLPKESKSETDKVFLLQNIFQAVTHRFFYRCQQELSVQEHGALGWAFNFTDSDLLREAASDFINDITYRIDSSLSDGTDLFETCCKISHLSYEKSEPLGKLILAEEDVAFIERSLEFAPPAEVSNLRIARKLLELTHNGLFLHSDSEKIYSLCKFKRHKSKDDNCFVIEFLGLHKWQIKHKGEILICVNYGTPSLPKLSFDATSYRRDLANIFKIRSPRKLNKLLEIIEIASVESKGALIVISDNAKSEAKRLGGQSISLKPTYLMPELTKSITPIDGAILIDPSGICYAIGSILDGLASDGGNSGRGARYNSSIRYIEYQKSLKVHCAAIVISEDGELDLIK